MIQRPQQVKYVKYSTIGMADEIVVFVKLVETKTVGGCTKDSRQAGVELHAETRQE